MQILSMTSEPWQEVLDRLPPDLDLDTLAVSSGALKRRREVGDGTTLLRLAMARGPGGLSLNQNGHLGGDAGPGALERSGGQVPAGPGGAVSEGFAGAAPGRAGRQPRAVLARAQPAGGGRHAHPAAGQHG